MTMVWVFIAGVFCGAFAMALVIGLTQMGKDDSD